MSFSRRAFIVAIILVVVVLLAADQGSNAYPIAPAGTQCRQVTGEGVNIRSGPGKNFPVQGRLRRCGRVHYLGKKVAAEDGSGDYAAIWWGDNGQHWINAKYLVSLFRRLEGFRLMDAVFGGKDLEEAGKQRERGGGREVVERKQMTTKLATSLFFLFFFIFFFLL